MAWTTAYPGSIQGHAMIPDYDNVFDNQQRFRGEFLEQHSQVDSGSTEGYHKGVHAVRAFGNTTTTGDTTVLTVTAAELNTSDCWIFFLSQYTSATDGCWFETLIDSEWYKTGSPNALDTSYIAAHFSTYGIGLDTVLSAYHGHAGPGGYATGLVGWTGFKLQMVDGALTITLQKPNATTTYYGVVGVKLSHYPV